MERLDKVSQKTLTTSLLTAARNGGIKRARTLLEKGADVNAREKRFEGSEDYNNTPLHYACKSGNSKLVGLLLDVGAKVNLRDSCNNMPLHCACLNGYDDIAFKLLRANARPNVWGDGGTALAFAAVEGNVKTMRVLLENGAKVDFAGFDRYTALHRACEFGRADSVALLLDYGADINVQNENDATPIEEAINLPDDNPAREEIINVFVKCFPETVLKNIINLPPEDPLREKTLDWYREHHPELVMEAWCTI